MTTAPGADERRIRAALDARGVGYAPQPPAPTMREQDWLDDFFAATTQTRPPDPPKNPPPAVAAGEGEPRWDWRRLLHWPYARLCCGATTALIPWYDGYSTATGWGHVLASCRTEATTGAAYVIASVGLTIAAVVTHQRRWYGWLLLTSAFIGTVYMASPLDVIHLITGAPQ